MIQQGGWVHWERGCSGQSLDWLVFAPKQAEAANRRMFRKLWKTKRLNWCIANGP